MLPSLARVLLEIPLSRLGFESRPDCLARPKASSMRKPAAASSGLWLRIREEMLSKERISEGEAVSGCAANKHSDAIAVIDGCML